MKYHHIEAFIQKHSTRAERRSLTDPPPPPADIPFQDIDRIRRGMQDSVRNGTFQVPGAIMKHLREDAQRAMRADAFEIKSATPAQGAEDTFIHITKQQAYL